jgi:hypothetical protein
VITTDRVAWYKPGYAEVVYGGAYGRYLQGFALPRLVFMEEIVGHGISADLKAELQRRLDGDGCPILAWSVHNVSPEAFAGAKHALLAAVDRAGAESTVKTKTFRDGEVGFILYRDPNSRP